MFLTLLVHKLWFLFPISRILSIMLQQLPGGREWIHLRGTGCCLQQGCCRAWSIWWRLCCDDGGRVHAKVNNSGENENHHTSSLLSVGKERLIFSSFWKHSQKKLVLINQVVYCTRLRHRYSLINQKMVQLDLMDRSPALLKPELLKLKPVCKVKSW